ncbi:cysteine desulfurase sulfur acceptor subunit CsdE [Enterobacter roggenkampii]|uniref:cysteine desulfurase sulfur acceptor subunit CsdE n=1 Tax=Enterobacter roggenkampii TaxID=1812935 RepID=UPI000750D5C8|nr:cysteine desulfurase sulfur acceptor subunit CsdE [Enterobacter roggenkampii]KUR09157.1 CsdA-binding activator [Enterobacter roggenkampii]
MTHAALAGHPFGTVITEDTLKQTFAPLSQWEDKYRQLILLGKQLPTLSDDLKAQAKEIAGCENRVWLGVSVSGEKLHFFGDSEGRIVRGLLAVLLTAVEGKSAAEGPKRMDCASGFGAATMVTASFGFVAVSHALKKMMAKAERQA